MRNKKLIGFLADSNEEKLIENFRRKNGFKTVSTLLRFLVVQSIREVDSGRPLLQKLEAKV